MKLGRRPAAGTRSARLEVDGVELVVLSWPIGRAGLPPSPALPEGAARLTDAERDVIQLVLAGHTDAEIAERRGTSARTVHKQVASAYRKLGVRSRRELWAKSERDR